MGEAKIEELDETTCLELISRGGVGRLAYAGRFGLVVIPVNYRLHEKTIVFRTAEGSPMDEDLRTGITDAEYRVAFEIDELDMNAHEGWSVLIQGSAHHVESPEEHASVTTAGIETWPGGDKELFLRVMPARITGRRIHRS
jgi:nitroimidazol reductase NimA-like FMN-containing flavoprotein (pyridoxamine 5'-phosphate oxidase superfamily)